jgi:hypothetical protein
MVMSRNLFAQRYVDGRYKLRYLPLFNTMNDTLNHPGRLPKLLQTHGKRAAKKNGKVVTCCALCSTFYRARRRQVSHCFGVGYRFSSRRGRPPERVSNSTAVHQGQPRI